MDLSPYFRQTVLDEAEVFYVTALCFNAHSPKMIDHR